MIDLTSYLGIPIEYDNRKDKLIIDDNINVCNIEITNTEEVRPTLLNKTIKYPDYIYTEYRKLNKKTDQDKLFKCGLKHNLLVIPPNLLGIEFAKTHCYTHPHEDKPKLSCVLECVYGVMTVVMQSRKPKECNKDPYEIFEVGLVKAKRGEKVVVPCGYDFTIVNTRSQVSVISKIYMHDFRLDYRTIQREQGLAYYVIRKNARQENVINPKYKDVPKLKKIKAHDMMKEYKLDARTSLYSQVLKNPEKFVKLMEVNITV